MCCRSKGDVTNNFFSSSYINHVRRNTSGSTSLKKIKYLRFWHIWMKAICSFDEKGIKHISNSQKNNCLNTLTISPAFYFRECSTHFTYMSGEVILENNCLSPLLGYFPLRCQALISQLGQVGHVYSCPKDTNPVSVSIDSLEPLTCPLAPLV